MKKIDKKTKLNIYFIREDAFLVDQMFEHEISKIYLNFSDPWPKERHAKRRLTSPIFLEKYNLIFKGKKEIQMKTDNRGLFEYSLVSLNESGYKITDISLDLHNSSIENNVMTEYETKFSKMGKTIYMGIFCKNQTIDLL